MAPRSTQSASEKAQVALEIATRRAERARNKVTNLTADLKAAEVELASAVQAAEYARAHPALKRDDPVAITNVIGEATSPEPANELPIVAAEDDDTSVTPPWGAPSAANGWIGGAL